MKKFLMIVFVLFNVSSYGQSISKVKLPWEFIDLAQVQIRLLNEYYTSDSAVRHKIYLDSVYRPHKQFWRGYSGDENSFVGWMDYAANKYSDYLNNRNREVDGQLIPSIFEKTCKKMYQLTGFWPKGKWYVVFFMGTPIWAA